MVIAVGIVIQALSKGELSDVNKYDHIFTLSGTEHLLIQESVCYLE